MSMKGNPKCARVCRRRQAKRAQKKMKEEFGQLIDGKICRRFENGKLRFSSWPSFSGVWGLG